MLHRGCQPSLFAMSLDISQMQLKSSSWSQGTWIISLGQMPSLLCLLGNLRSLLEVIRSRAEAVVLNQKVSY